VISVRTRRVVQCFLASASENGETRFSDRSILPRMPHEKRPTESTAQRLPRVRSVLLVLPLALAPFVSACAPTPPTTARGAATPAPQAPPSARCAAPEHRQFDFWAGDWDTFERDNPRTSVARMHANVILDGCAIHEVYEQDDGLVGQSFTAYDATRKVWNHTWVTNRGGLMVIEGKAQSEGLVLQGTQRGGAEEKTVRLTWTVEPDGGVGERAESSADGGATWKPMFDMVFRRHTS
jgi:hypothetical protein